MRLRMYATGKRNMQCCLRQHLPAECDDYVIKKKFLIHYEYSMYYELILYDIIEKFINFISQGQMTFNCHTTYKHL